jgi:formylglycine-generating enzyme required for sulfatase activity
MLILGEGIMRRFVCLLSVVLFVSILSGCIISKTPSSNSVTMTVGDQMTFSVEVLPSGGTFDWTLDGAPLSNTEKSYMYTADAGQHILTVTFTHTLGTDAQSWVISCETIDPITDLLNSMVSIPGGSFEMGLTTQHSALPIHTVTLSDFKISSYEITQKQYTALIGKNPSVFKETGTENKPVDTVNWYDALVFCKRLSAQTGRTFMLPSEAQWEYACRAGSTGKWYFGDYEGLFGDYAWYIGNSYERTNSVGTKLPNAWGLYDMHGNVSEWCFDSWHDSYEGAPTDGSAWSPFAYTLITSDHSMKGYWKVARGSSFLHIPQASQDGTRSYEVASAGYWSHGFRIVELP